MRKILFILIGIEVLIMFLNIYHLVKGDIPLAVVLITLNSLGILLNISNVDTLEK